MVFSGFGLLIAGVAANLLLLQPATVPSRTGADPAQARLEAERRQRLALDANQPTQPAPHEQVAQARMESDVPKSDDVRRPIPSGPPRATSGGPHPVAILPPIEQGPKRLVRLKPDAAQADQPIDTLPDAPEAEGDPTTIRAVQRELTERGYGPLVSDGVPGLVTRAAIMAFEHDNRIALTGEATEKLLARLLMGASGPAGPAADPSAGRVRSAQAEIVMRTVQQSLVALGYQVGRIDGRAGEETQRAIREFELDEGLAPTGRVSAEVFSRLGRTVASARPQPVR
jgi:peptidoglycan hydrolase-like protein with peptidoglycan-binding domain